MADVIPINQDVAAMRVPPSNLQAEQLLLGCILTHPNAYRAVEEFLKPEHFADPRHGAIYRASVTMIERGETPNAVTLKNHFEGKRGELSLDELGGSAYLAKLQGAVVTIADAKNLGRLVHDCFLRRELIDIGTVIANGALSFDDLNLPATDQISLAEQRLYDLATRGQSDGKLLDLDAALTLAVNAANRANNSAGKLSGVTTGLRDVDALLGGLQASDLIILAGRPGMGKSALAGKIAFSAAQAAHRGTAGGCAVAFFTLEMSTEQCAMRWLAEQSRVPVEKIRRGEVREADFPQFVAVSAELQGMPLFIDDTPALSLTQVRARARRLKRQRPNLGLIVVDYLQLMTAPMGARPENRVQEVSLITRGLKGLAKELNVPVVALSQLNRGVEQREDKRPALSDLRESGTIEQDADVVGMVYRPAYYVRRPERTKGETDASYDAAVRDWEAEIEPIKDHAELIIEKNRHGRTDAIALKFDGPFTAFGDASKP